MTFNNGDCVELTIGRHKGKFGTVKLAQAGKLPKGVYSYVHIPGCEDSYGVYNSDLRLVENEKDYESDF